jgi:hypothetical protein
MAARVGEFGEPAEPEQIGSGVQGQAVRRIQALTSKHPLGDGQKGRIFQGEGGGTVRHAISLAERA